MTKEEERRRRAAQQARRRRRKKRRTAQLARRCAVAGIGIFFAILIGTRVFRIVTSGGVGAQKLFRDGEGGEFQQKVIEQTPDYQVALLTPNPNSRPQTALKKVDGIVIHYTANPGTTAMQNRNYFEGLKDGQGTKASSHFIIGLEGEVVQCIPSTEVAYASNDRNSDTLSIECCHMDETGKFTEKTYDSLVGFTAWLCGKFNVPVENVIRHYDVTGKDCPRYYVRHEDEWQEFKEDVQRYLDTYGKDPET